MSLGANRDYKSWHKKVKESLRKSRVKQFGECFFCAEPATAGTLKHLYLCPECMDKVNMKVEGYEID